MAKQEQKKRGRFSALAQKSSVWRKSVWLRVWQGKSKNAQQAGAKKTQNKILNKERKNANLKFKINTKF